jgi:chaperonin GroEL (HSP60 family)
MSLAAGLIARGWESGHPIALVLQAYRTAEKWTLEFLERMSVKVVWGDMKCMLQLAKSALQTKAVCRLSVREVDFLAVLLVQAFIAGLTMDHAAGVISVPMVRVLCLVGRDSLASEMLNGVLVDIPLPPGAPRTMGATSTVLYNVNLDFSASEQFSEHVPVAVVARAGDEGEWAASELSRRAMEELCEEWARLGVGLVASQKRIHPYLKHRLLAIGVVPLERLSIRHIQALHSVIGGKLLGTLKLEAMRVPGARGHLEGMRERVLGGRRYLQLDSIPGGPKKSTLLAWAVDQQAADELEVQLEGVLLLLRHALKDGAVVPGGGCFEALLAAHLRAKVKASEAEDVGSDAESRLLRGMLRECVLLFAEVVQRFVASLAPSALGGAATLSGVEESTRLLLEANTRVPIAPNAPHRYWGWRHRRPLPVEVLRVAPSTGGGDSKGQKAVVGDCDDNTIMDLALVKRRALQQAVETAGVILRLDCLLAHTTKSVQSSDVG